VGEREGDEETEGRWDQPFGCDQNPWKTDGRPASGMGRLGLSPSDGTVDKTLPVYLEKVQDGAPQL